MSGNRVNSLGRGSRPARFILDALSYPKVAPFRDGRMIAAGFLAHRGWGGDVVFRELLQEEDGTLGSRFVPEMIPRTGDDLPLLTTSESAAAISEDTATANGANGFRAIPLTGIPRDVRITFQAVPDGNATEFGIGLRSTADHSHCLELRVEPAGAKAGLFAVDENRENANAPANQRHRLGKLDAPLTIDIVCRRDIVDVEIGGRRTLIRRYWILVVTASTCLPKAAESVSRASRYARCWIRHRDRGRRRLNETTAND